jgi:hypothetical protein
MFRFFPEMFWFSVIIMNMKRLIQIPKILAINSLILVFGFVILEITFGGWLNNSKLNRLNLVKDRVLNFDVSQIYKDPHPITKYSRDKYGLRTNNLTPNNIEILTVGGSTTDQRLIRDGETWQDVLHKCLEQAGMPLGIANAGVDGQSTYGHIKNFEWWFPYIPDLKPKYILFYVGLNDFYKDVGDDYDRLGPDDKNFNLKEEIKKNSVFWYMFRTFRDAYIAMVVKKIGHGAINFSESSWTREALQNDYSFMNKRLNDYRDRLRILADLTYKFGAKPIFVSQPSRMYRFTANGIVGWSKAAYYDSDYQYNGVDFYYMMRKLDSVTRAVAIEKGASFVDLASHNIWVDDDFYDLIHMTPQGAKKVGEELAKELIIILNNNTTNQQARQ